LRWDAARVYAERAIRVNPWRWQYHQTLATIHAQHEDWRAAIQECQEVLKLHATSRETRRLLVACYLRAGDSVRARAELDLLLLLTPTEQQESLRRWFEQQVR
jgi:Flp pilus assembly protein TadD